MKKVILCCKHGVLNLFLVAFLFAFLAVNKYAHACVQDSYGGQCVEYVRNYFGGDYQLMPGLCQYNLDCGAYNAWGHWDLGFGSGHIPAENSIMVINQQLPGIPEGHMAVIISVNSNSDGTYTLNVHESNGDLDELVDCNVIYTFYPEDSEVTRKNGITRYPVLGFIYGSSLLLYVDKNHPSPSHPECVDRTGTIDDPYCTIQEGIDAAETGNTILVADGTYYENINFNGNEITVKATNGSEGTTIDGNSSGSVVTFTSSENENSILDGFTITNGFAASGGGIHCVDSSPTITNCTINNNSANNSGGGIYCWGASPSIASCNIKNNIAGAGGGIYYDGFYVGEFGEKKGLLDDFRANEGKVFRNSVYSSFPDSITNCIISSNSASIGGGICLLLDSPMINNCTISGNIASSNGAGIYCIVHSSPIVVNSILWGNVGEEIYLDGDSSIDFTYSDVEGGWLTGIGNIDANPFFDSNYRLQPGSPCIDAGTSTGAPEYDFEGDPRLISVGGDNMPDIGADEYINNSPCLHDGDVNNDSNITPQDALMVFQQYIGIIQLDDCQQNHANVNGDGSITPADALCIFQKYLGLLSCLD